MEVTARVSDMHFLVFILRLKNALRTDKGSDWEDITTEDARELFEDFRISEVTFEEWLKEYIP